MSELKCRVLDLDGTISDDRWRRWLIDPQAATVDEMYHHYHLHLDQDQFVNKWTLDCDVPIVILTARPEYTRELTMRWLERHNVEFQQLLMRPEGDHRSSPLLKLGLIAEHNLQEIEYAFDDREDVIAAFRSVGIPCAQITV